MNACICHCQGFPSQLWSSVMVVHCSCSHPAVSVPAGELQLGMSCRSILVDRELQEAARTDRDKRARQVHALQRIPYECSGLTPQQQLAIMDAHLQGPKAARGRDHGPQTTRVEGLTR